MTEHGDKAAPMIITDGPDELKVPDRVVLAQEIPGSIIDLTIPDRLRAMWDTARSRTDRQGSTHGHVLAGMAGIAGMDWGILEMEHPPALPIPAVPQFVWLPSMNGSWYMEIAP